MNNTIENEVWKPVTLSKYNHYLVSSHGRIKNSKRKKDCLSPDMSKGYPVIALSSNGVKRKFYVHRIVALAFIPNDSTERRHINHINGIKHDNRISNLEWCTPQENSKHAWETGLMISYRENFSRFRERDFLESIYIRFKYGETLTTLAEEHNIDVSSLSVYLKDQYGKRHIEDIYNSEIHGRIPKYKIDEFYQLILSGYTIQDISKKYGIDEDIRYRIYHSYGREHVHDLLKQNVSAKKKRRSKERFDSMKDEISTYYDMLNDGYDFSAIGKKFNVTHKTIRKRLNMKYGKRNIDKIRFS